MLIFPDLKFVYLACPKTGTTAFEEAFGPYADAELSQTLTKHARYSTFRRTFPGLARKSEVVTCVRDPLETLHSWYRYRSRAVLQGTDRSTRGLSFEAFFEEWCKDDPAPYADVAPSVTFVTNRRGKLFKGLKVVRYEDAYLLFAHIATRLGIDPRFERRNASPPANRGLLDRIGAALGLELFRPGSQDCEAEDDLPLKQRVDLTRPKISAAYDIYDRIPFVRVEDLQGAKPEATLATVSAGADDRR